MCNKADKFNPGNFDIFFSFSQDRGQAFSITPDNLTRNAGDSFFPQISSTSS
ncbi:MAG TPA: hypothetical protein VFK40_12450 [Nitrososphaeraceae archaeon]|nr:hypothetical protein [Nitrososphaeraceae archaeon]